MSASRVPLSSMANGTVLQKVSGAFLPAPGASASVYLHDPSSTLWGGANAPVHATVFSTELGVGTLTQPLSADSNGALPGWVNQGQDLDIVASFAGQTAAPALAEPDIASSVVSRSSAISSNVVPRIYAPLPTGVAATDTANLNALASPPAPMPGVIVELGAGTYVHNGGLPQNTGVYWEGQGDGITVIQLANGANADLVKSANFDSLVGTNSLLGVTQCGMSKLSLDGNNANNTVGACLKIYGWGFRLKEITVHHAATRNLWTEHGEGGYPADEDTTGVGLEARFDDITSHHAGTDGWYNNGPHDSLGDNIICYRNGAKGYWQGPNAQGFLGGKLHSWGSTHTYAAYLESSCVFTNLIAEGATGAGQVMVGANNIQLKVWAFGNNLTTQKNGILIGDGSHTNVSGYTIEGVLQSFPSGAIQFNSDGGGRIRVLIQGDPNPNQTIVSTGTPAGSTTIDWWTTNNNNVTPSATFPSYVPAALNAFDAFRSSEVATMPRLLAGITSGAPSTTNIVAARAIARSTGTFSKIRACSATAGGTLTDVRLGVWDINGNVLAYTANLVAAGVITNGLLDNQALNVSVALVQGTAVYLGVICLGTTNPTFRGANTGAGAIGAIAPVLTQNNTTTWAGGAPPNITLGGSTFFLPWLELIP